MSLPQLKFELMSWHFGGDKFTAKYFEPVIKYFS